MITGLLASSADEVPHVLAVNWLALIYNLYGFGSPVFHGLLLFTLAYGRRIMNASTGRFN